MTDVVWLKGDVSTGVRFGQTADRVVLEWPGLIRLSASRSIEDVELVPLTDIAPDLLAKMSRFAHAIPRYLAGAVLFHGAAVAWGHRALLLLGENGAGKSTTAALLCRAGASLLSDDTAVGTFVNDRFVLHPLEDTHWLDRRARQAIGRLRPGRGVEGKCAVPAPRIRVTPAELAAVVFMRSRGRGELTVAPKQGAESARRLLDASLHLPLGARRAKQDFDAVARVAKRVRVFDVLRGTRFSSKLVERLVKLVDT